MRVAVCGLQPPLPTEGQCSDCPGGHWRAGGGGDGCSQITARKVPLSTAACRVGLRSGRELRAETRQGSGCRDGGSGNPREKEADGGLKGTSGKTEPFLSAGVCAAGLAGRPLTGPRNARRKLCRFNTCTRHARPRAPQVSVPQAEH